MFELPELATLARQMNETLCGKTIRSGALGNSPHKFVWYNRTPEEFAALTAGKTLDTATRRGKWLFVPVEPGYVLVFGELGGKLLGHAPGAQLPGKYHLLLSFEDGWSMSSLTQMWGAYELYEKGRELERDYVKDMRPSPGDLSFSMEYFGGLIDSLIVGQKRSVKGLLTQEQLVPGVGNSIAQDIMFRAGLHPRHSLGELDANATRRLFDAVCEVVAEATAQGGRNDEVDFYGRPGGYVRLMDAKAAGKPCPQCGTIVEKIQYLGGACYFCPRCQL